MAELLTVGDIRRVISGIQDNHAVYVDAYHLDGITYTRTPLRIGFERAYGPDVNGLRFDAAEGLTLAVHMDDGEERSAQDVKVTLLDLLYIASNGNDVVLYDLTKQLKELFGYSEELLDEWSELLTTEADERMVVKYADQYYYVRNHEWEETNVISWYDRSDGFVNKVGSSGDNWTVADMLDYA